MRERRRRQGHNEVLPPDETRQSGQPPTSLPHPTRGCSSAVETDGRRSRAPQGRSGLSVRAQPGAPGRQLRANTDEGRVLPRTTPGLPGAMILGSECPRHRQRPALRQRAPYNALRLAGALSKREGVELRVFLLGDAVACAVAGQQLAELQPRRADRLDAAVGQDARLLTAEARPVVALAAPPAGLGLARCPGR